MIYPAANKDKEYSTDVFYGWGVEMSMHMTVAGRMQPVKAASQTKVEVDLAILRTGAGSILAEVHVRGNLWYLRPAAKHARRRPQECRTHLRHVPLQFNHAPAGRPEGPKVHESIVMPSRRWSQQGVQERHRPHRPMLLEDERGANSGSRKQRYRR